MEEAYITTPVLLPEHILSDLSALFQKRYDVKIRIHQLENPDLILGGLIVWDNTMTDFSLAPQFYRMEHNMLHEISWDRFKPSSLKNIVHGLDLLKIDRNLF